MEETKETTQQSSSNTNEQIHKRFATEREDWTSKVTSLSERLRNIYELSDLLTDLYSQRQIAVEYTHTIMGHMTKVNKIFREKKVERFDFYTRQYDIRLDKDPKNDRIAADLTDIVERRELLQNHLDYMRESVKTIDGLCYAVKHRMELEQYKRG